MHWLANVESILSKLPTIRNDFVNILPATPDNNKAFDFKISNNDISINISNKDIMGETVASFSDEINDLILKSNYILFLLDIEKNIINSHSLQPRTRLLLQNIINLKKNNPNYKIGVVFTKVDTMPYGQLPSTHFHQINDTIKSIFNKSNNLRIFYISCKQFWVKFNESDKSNLSNILKINPTADPLPYSIHIPFLWLLSEGIAMHKEEKRQLQIKLQNEERLMKAELERQRLIKEEKNKVAKLEGDIRDLRFRISKKIDECLKNINSVYNELSKTDDKNKDNIKYNLKDQFNEINQLENRLKNDKERLYGINSIDELSNLLVEITSLEKEIESTTNSIIINIKYHIKKYTDENEQKKFMYYAIGVFLLIGLLVFFFSSVGMF